MPIPKPDHPFGTIVSPYLGRLPAGFPAYRTGSAYPPLRPGRLARTSLDRHDGPVRATGRLLPAGELPARRLRGTGRPGYVSPPCPTPPHC